MPLLILKHTNTTIKSSLKITFKNKSYLKILKKKNYQRPFKDEKIFTIHNIVNTVSTAVWYI